LGGRDGLEWLGTMDRNIHETGTAEENMPLLPSNANGREKKPSFATIIVTLAFGEKHIVAAQNGMIMDFSDVKASLPRSTWLTCGTTHRADFSRSNAG
jgi:hypothetical protein